jgi:hypothetical protein
MSRRLSVFALIAGLGMAAGAVADEPPSPQFQQFALRPENHQGVVKVLQAQWFQTIGTACASIKPVDWRVTIYQPVRFNPDGTAASGLWKEIVTSEGCGVRKVFNVGSVVNQDGSIRRIGLLPGTTHADPQLEADGLIQARAAAVGVLPKDCAQTMIIDTNFLTPEGVPALKTVPGRDPQPWREEWTVKGCDAKAIVIMHFVPDATGTGIHAALSETRRG